MKISEFLTEEQLDELSWQQVGQGAANVARRVGQIGGAVAGGIHGAIDAGRKAYEPARAAVSGDLPPDFSHVTPPLTDQQANQLKQGVTADNVMPALSAQQQQQVNQSLVAAQQSRRGSYAPPNASQSAASTPRASRPTTSNVGQPGVTSQPQSAAPSPNRATRLTVPQGKKVIDDAIVAINSVRSDRRSQVVKYAKEQINKLV